MNTERRRLLIRGLVQGVGFRPTIFRLARQFQLSGWASNTSAGLVVELQGDATALDQMISQIERAPPDQAVITELTVVQISPSDERGFHILADDKTTPGTTRIMVDLAPCPACTDDIRNPQNRRYQYPFTHCTQCGPRFSLVTALPYHRANTTLAPFALCQRCQDEFNDPGNRRFQAELIACPDCGPQLGFYLPPQTKAADKQSQGNQALAETAKAIAAGQIIAIKGVGGFQLVCDARNGDAVTRLRARKHRPGKPFAVMYPSLEALRRDCLLSAEEEKLLLCPQRPIVLVTAKPGLGNGLGNGIAPGNPNLGVMLPSSPLHQLLLDCLQHPIVATSGNMSGDSLCYRNEEALARLGNIADGFLMHNREIARPLDDSVLRIMAAKPVFLRRARGFAPTPIPLTTIPLTTMPLTTMAPPQGLTPPTILAVGGQQKNTIAINKGHDAFISPHIGDLENLSTQQAFQQAVSDSALFNGEEAAIIAHDLHPGYLSTEMAQQMAHNENPSLAGQAATVGAQACRSLPRKRTSTPAVAIQHHIGHFFSVMAEHQHRGPALGFCWDGSGMGSDGTLWGGETFTWDGNTAVARIASLCPFPLPGGSQAIREPRRQALGLLYSLNGKDGVAQPQIAGLFSAEEQQNLLAMLANNLNCPQCSSIGRLFDAIAALLGLVAIQSFEGEAAMALEFCAQTSDTREAFAIDLIAPTAGDTGAEPARIDVKPLITGLLAALQAGEQKSTLARMFHNSLVAIMVNIAHRAGLRDIFLSGGVFQNKQLVESAISQLEHKGFKVLIHRQVPPNDGGLALGQLYYSQCLQKLGEPACA